jgi:hypothetical protein
MRLTLNGCACAVFAAAFLAVGIMFIVFGRQLAPRDNAAAQVFRTDPSCTAPLTVAAPPGECTVVAATVLVARMRMSNSMGRTRGRTPYVYLHFADGSAHSDDLVGSDGRDFVESVRSGALARAQLFRGTLVRVTSGRSSAETISAPDYSATTDSQMPWVGAVLIAIAALFGYGGFRATRRTG